MDKKSTTRKKPFHNTTRCPYDKLFAQKSITIPYYLLSHFSSTEISVLSEIIWRIDNSLLQPQKFSLYDIAGELNLSVSTIKRALKSLTSIGLIKTQKGQPHNLYTINQKKTFELYNVINEKIETAKDKCMPLKYYTGQRITIPKKFLNHLSLNESLVLMDIIWYYRWLILTKNVSTNAPFQFTYKAVSTKLNFSKDQFYRIFKKLKTKNLINVKRQKYSRKGFLTLNEHQILNLILDNSDVAILSSGSKARHTQLKSATHSAQKRDTMVKQLGKTIGNAKNSEISFGLEFIQKNYSEKFKKFFLGIPIVELDSIENLVKSFLTSSEDIYSSFLENFHFSAEKSDCSVDNKNGGDFVVIPTETQSYEIQHNTTAQSNNEKQLGMWEVETGPELYVPVEGDDRIIINPEIEGVILEGNMLYTKREVDILSIVGKVYKQNCGGSFRFGAGAYDKEDLRILNKYSLTQISRMAFDCFEAWQLKLPQFKYKPILRTIAARASILENGIDDIKAKVNHNRMMADLRRKGKINAGHKHERKFKPFIPMVRDDDPWG